MTNPQLNVASTKWLNDGRKQAYNQFHSKGRVQGPINVCVCVEGVWEVAYNYVHERNIGQVFFDKC